eukprot:tig00000821_g4498.t1
MADDEAPELPVRYGREPRDCEACRQRPATLFFVSAPRSRNCLCASCASAEGAQGVPIDSVRSVGKQPQCQKHKDQLVAFYCEVTSELLCTACISAAPHDRHAHVALEDDEFEDKLKRRIAQSKLILERAIRQTTAVRGEMRTALAEISGAKLTVNETAEATKLRIEERFANLLKILTRRKEELLSQVDGIKDAKFKKLEEQKARMEGQVERLDAALELSQNVLDDGDYIEALTLTERLEGCLRVDAGSVVSSAGEPNTIDATFEAAGEAPLEEAGKRWGRVGLRLPKPRPLPQLYASTAAPGEASRPPPSSFAATPVHRSQERPASSRQPGAEAAAFQSFRGSRPPSPGPGSGRRHGSPAARASHDGPPPAAGLPLRVACAGDDGCLRVYAVLDGGAGLEPGRLVRAHDGALSGGAAGVRACAMTGNLVVTGGDEGTVKVWDFESPEQPLAELPDRGEAVTALAATGSRLFVGTEDGRVRMYALLGLDPATRSWGRDLAVQLLRTLVARSRAAPVASLAATPRLLAAGFGDGTAKLWEAQGGSGDAGPALFRAHAEAVTAVALGRSLLATGGGDGAIKIWGLRDVNRAIAERGGASGGLRAPPCLTVASSDGPVHSLAFAPTLPGADGEAAEGAGELLVSASPRGDVRAWDPETGDVAAVLAGSEAGECTAACVAAGVVFAGRSSGFLEVWERLHVLEAGSGGPHASGPGARRPSPGRSLAHVRPVVKTRFTPARSSPSPKH